MGGLTALHGDNLLVSGRCPHCQEGAQLAPAARFHEQASSATSTSRSLVRSASSSAWRSLRAPSARTERNEKPAAGSLVADEAKCDINAACRRREARSLRENDRRFPLVATCVNGGRVGRVALGGEPSAH